MSGNIGPFGDTTLTKVFVGGLAWETPKEAMKEHFDKYGEILEAVIISDKVSTDVSYFLSTPDDYLIFFMRAYE